MPHPVIERYEAVRNEIKKVIIGQGPLIDLALIGFLAGGHIILEGVPGLAKTLFAKSLAASLALNFRRIQFTPDLMPSDLIGTNVFLPDKQQFRFIQGPVFTDILLGDEINRTPPKTQSALLEAMEERQATVDGQLYKLPDHFFVIATQNPIEYEGTFPLPEAQVDRFLFKIKLSYPSHDEELALLKHGASSSSKLSDVIKATSTAEDLATVRTAIDTITVRDNIYDYLLRLVNTTRQSPQVSLGASPRAALGWLRAAKVRACLQQREFVTPDDLKFLAAPVLRHRLVLKPEAEIEGVNVEQVITQILATVDIPR
ncbi:MAG: AAA family ATPase [Candidatus Methylacidiphilales bacterium]|nr:MoxR family ATPase [Candidatus Methylacidiphilales bacterium]